MASSYAFISTFDPPDHIPSTRFFVPPNSSPDERWVFFGCRHGLAVLFEESRRETVVWDPLTGQQHRVASPPGICVDERNTCWQAAVLCADAEDGHVHGDCFSSPFKLVLIWVVRSTQAFACLYESMSGAWGDIVSTATPDTIFEIRPSVLVRNALCWLLCGGDVLAFDFERQSLDVIKKPADAHITDHLYVQLFRTVDSELGLAYFSELTTQLWERKSNCDGVVGWVLPQNSSQFNASNVACRSVLMLIAGYDEDTNVIVLTMLFGDFVVQLDSMEIIHSIERKNTCYKTFYPYTNFYAAGREVGWKWLDLKL